MKSTTPSNISYHHVPRDDPSKLSRLAQKYRELRLMGLRLSPEAFSSTLDREASYPEEFWTSRLMHHELQTFVCAVPRDDQSGEQDVDQDVKWIAQVTLRGPVSAEDFELPEEAGQPRQTLDQATSEERWQILSLYLLPEYRGQGIAKQLCIEVLRYLEKHHLNTSPSLKAIQVRTMIKLDNESSLQLFRKIGFVNSGLVTRLEGMIANGETLPPGVENDPDFNWRGGQSLICRINKS